MCVCVSVCLCVASSDSVGGARRGSLAGSNEAAAKERDRLAREVADLQQKKEALERQVQQMGRQVCKGWCVCVCVCVWRRVTLWEGRAVGRWREAIRVCASMWGWACNRMGGQCVCKGVVWCVCVFVCMHRMCGQVGKPWCTWCVLCTRPHTRTRPLTHAHVTPTNQQKEAVAVAATADLIGQMFTAAIDTLLGK